MYIRCPKCGRRGRLPDRWIPQAQSLRCRKCGAMFKTPELARVAAERGPGPAFDPIVGVGRADRPEPFVADGYFSAFDDALIGPRPPGPGDSNYELTFTLSEPEGDFGPDWDAETGEFEPEAPSSDDITALSTAGAPWGSERWHHRFIESWGLRLVVTALVLIGISVPMIAYLLWRTIGSGQPSDSPAPTLIAGFAAGVGLLMISVPLFLLAASVSELVRDGRRRDPVGEDRGLIERR
jgi:zinc-ribbon domain